VPSSVENSSPAELDQSLVFTHGYWVRSDMAEQDLVVVQDVALLNAVYKDCVSTGGSIIVPRDELSRVAAETALVPTLRVGTDALDALRRDPKNPARVQLGEYWPDFRPVKTLTLEELMRDHALQAMRRPIIEDEYRPVGRSPRFKALAVFARPFGLGRSVKLHQIASVVSLRSASLALLSHDPQLPRFSRQYPINSWVARNVTLRPIRKSENAQPAADTRPYSRSHAPRGNARSDALRRAARCEHAAPPARHDAERRHAGSHAERGNQTII
jgi:hypothetical protein